jgi:hypothetical protein
MKIIISLIIFCLVLVLALALTGHDKRAYFVLPPDRIIEIAENKTTISDLASSYKPKMYLRPSTPSPPLLWIWYEAIPTEDTIDIVYYFTWENEIHPNPVLNIFYSFFRSKYYGTPLYDIEYLQINVERTSGKIKKIRFETSPEEDYFITISEHLMVSYFRKSGNIYDEILMTRKGELVDKRNNVQINFDETHVLVGVQTWNHLTRIITNEDDDFSVLQDAPLIPLSEDDYSHYKFVRKSQGDHKTKEKRWALLLANVSIFIFIFLPWKIVSSLFIKSKRTE